MPTCMATFGTGWLATALVGMASVSAVFATPDPHCATGIVDTGAGEFCCARECGECGGKEIKRTQPHYS